MIKPNRLKPGSRIALVSPSWGGASIHPYIFDEGVRVLEERFRFKTVEYPTAKMNNDKLLDNPQLRARDLNRAFADENIGGIIASIGGCESIRILPYLDKDLIMNNPKPIMGFSDATTYLAYLSSLGMVTYYGPSVMAGFSQLGNWPETAREYDLFFSNPAEFVYEPVPGYCQSYGSWSPETVGGVGPVFKTDGHLWLNKGGTARGALWGGCIELLDIMVGTPFWPSKDFFKGKILLIETSEDKPLPAQIGMWLRNYGAQGILSRLSGLLVARPKDYREEEKEELADVIKRVVIREFGCGDLNILLNLDAGHTDPMHIFPLGCELEIDPAGETLKLTESPFREENHEV